MGSLYDFVEPLERILEILQKNGFSPRDVIYIRPYREFIEMRSHRDLYYNCLDELAARYGLSVGTMRKKFKLLSQRLQK